jgi:hypothetical protein
MAGSFSLDKVGLAAIVARLKKCSGGAVLWGAAANLARGPAVGERWMHREDPKKGVADRVRVMFEDNAAIKVQFGKENANRIAGVARHTADVLHHSAGGMIP